MYDKGLRIFIQGRSGKFLFIDEFDLTSGGKGLCRRVSPPGKLFSTKLKIGIAERQEKHL